MTFKLLSVVLVAVLLAACNDHVSTPESAAVAPSSIDSGPALAPAPVARMQADAVMEKGQGGETAPEQRRIAETQSWRFEVPASQLEEAWSTHHALCEDLGSD